MAALRRIVIDDTDPSIQYSPNQWTVANVALVQGGGNLGSPWDGNTTANGATISFLFSGSSLQVMGTVTTDTSQQQRSTVLLGQYPTYNADHWGPGRVKFPCTAVILSGFVPQELAHNTTTETSSVDDSPPMVFTLQGLVTAPNDNHTILFTCQGDALKTPLPLNVFYVTNSVSTALSSPPAAFLSASLAGPSSSAATTPSSSTHPISVSKRSPAGPIAGGGLALVALILCLLAALAAAVARRRRPAQTCASHVHDRHRRHRRHSTSTGMYAAAPSPCTLAAALTVLRVARLIRVQRLNTSQETVAGASSSPPQDVVIQRHEDSGVRMHSSPSLLASVTPKVVDVPPNYTFG
ncbi:hypothetical protein K438DRAFT_1964035 [Mycena galopus ATCC 62051]|nr:hypothetical protein K438DRAFT_1964035 [Mycena galopus ATCC 62051]